MAAKPVPRAFVFDLDGCCWDPEMYELWGGGAPFKENKDGSLSDKNGTRVDLLGDVKNILYELKTDPKYAGSIVAVASTCDEPRWAKECIRYQKSRKNSYFRLFHSENFLWVMG